MILNSPSPPVHSSITHLQNALQQCLQHVQNSLACAVIKASKSSHINPALKSLHWLKSKHRIDYKILSLAYKVLTTTQYSYLSYLCSAPSLHSFFRCRNPLSPTFLFLSEGQHPLFPSRVTLCLESAFQGTPSDYWSRRLISLIWSHTCQFVISFITTVTIHYSFSLPLQAKNSSFPQIFPP